MNGIQTVSRSCYWEDEKVDKNDCKNADTPANTKTEFCETCSTDGCNGAAQYGPIALSIAIPLMILSASHM